MPALFKPRMSAFDCWTWAPLAVGLATHGYWIAAAAAVLIGAAVSSALEARFQ